MKEETQILVGDTLLSGSLVIPETAKGIIVFAHGSGSSRHSTRNKKVASALQEAGFATLLFDLLTEGEDQDFDNRFDIDLLAERLIGVTDWLKTEEQTGDLAIGYFGASTGAAAALRAAAELGDIVRAVVSRGGRPDLAAPMLSSVVSPTMLIVGSLDAEVLELNEQAFATLRAEREIRIVEGADHLFEEPGKLEEVAKLALAWFDKYVISATL
ncbi:dienelactone hydrolase family protein [Olivibacter sp. XZL3]|uniref:dienelactone hydrolase family protein n=1 Tax=Olivibacter sp. XZL3 TaxID=1735116 RepID=UPI00197FD277|nr:alpha/beta fold hydrolase [Olivibacter sp. XZL3]